MKLTNQNWIPGSYDRRTLAGNLLQKKFRTAEISIVRAAAFCLAEDFLAEGLLKAGRISGPAYQAYLSALTDYFRTAEELTEGTDETVLAAVQRLRTEFFGETLFHARFREADLIAPERKETGIWQEAHLEAEWKKEAFVFFFSEAGESGSFLQVLQKALAARKRCFLLSFDDLQGRLPGAEDLKVLLNRAGIPDGAELLTVPAVSGAPDFSAVTLPENDAVLFGFGEEALLLTRNLTVPALLYVTPRSLTAKAVTNLFTKALPSLVYVPAGFDILPDVPLILPTKRSYYHLAELEKIHGEQVYSLSAEELERLAPGAFFSVYDDHFPLSIEPGFEWTEGSFLSALEACKLRKLNGFPGVRAYHGCFREETFEEVPIHWETGKKEAQVVVDGVRLSSQTPLKVLTDFPEPVSPRQYFFDQPGNEVRLISNFAFFYTHRLEAMYNFRRQDTPEECLHRPVGYLDHYRFTDPDGTRHETFPLYRKSCFARTRSGAYRTFSWILGGGEIECAPDTVLSWSAADVNPPAGTEQEIAVYTPLVSMSMEGQDPLQFLLPAGEGRLNLVVIGEYLNAAREGTVMIPPMGVILSLSGAPADRVRKTLGARNSRGYYESAANRPVRIRLHAPESVPEEEWENFEWVYGGGVGLLNPSAEMTEENFEEMLREEGWLSPLSRQTQESQIQKLVKHPRTAVGVTENGEAVILVFSGRSNVSAGANYCTMCRIARKMVPDLRTLVNWDGGASSLLALLTGNVLTELNVPSPTDESVAGMARPVSSMLTAVLKPGSGCF